MYPTPGGSALRVQKLIESLLEQVSSSVAELATENGARVPLSHVADRLFLELGRSLEARGVSRKVVSDMFGMTLRSYQRKMHRAAAEPESPRDTLWLRVLLRIELGGPLGRVALLRAFPRDDPNAVFAVLSDLSASGFVTREEASWAPGTP